MTPEQLAAPIGPTEADDLLEWLRGQYPDVRVLPDGSIACLSSLLTTTGVILGVSRWGWGRRFCYVSPARARKVFEALQGEDDEPTGWIARR